jgi:hypothetical protein
MYRLNVTIGSAETLVSVLNSLNHHHGDITIAVILDEMNGPTRSEIKRAKLRGETTGNFIDVRGEQSPPGSELQGLINQAQTLRMEAEEAAIRERLWGKGSEAEANINAARERVVAYGAAVHFDGSDYFIDGRKISQREFNEEMEARRRAREERAMTAWEAVESVGCPKCGAKRGDQCLSSGGHKYGRSKVHFDREMALIESRRDDSPPVAF